MNINELTTRMREFWLNLSSGQRRIAMFGILILVVATIYYVATPDKAPRERREQKAPYDFQQPEMAAEVMAEKLQNRSSLRKPRCNRCSSEWNSWNRSFNVRRQRLAVRTAHSPRTDQPVRMRFFVR